MVNGKKTYGMKKKAVSKLSLLLSTAMIVAVLGGAWNSSHMASVCAAKEDNKVYIQKTGYSELSEEEKAKKGRYEDAKARLADMQLVAEDEVASLYLDPEFAEFAVVDKESGESWFSNPYDFQINGSAGEDSAKVLQSLVKLTYYDKSAKEGIMNSFSDCTAKDQYTIEKLEKGFAIHMQIGRVEEEMLVPNVVDASKFEEKILPIASDKENRRLNSYYTKVSMLDAKLSDSVKEGYLKEYPGLEEHDFYILRSVVDREKRMIEEIIKKSEYTLEDMQEDLENSGYEAEEASSALFNMSLYVELDNGDLKITVPAESIVYDDTEYYLARFQLLNYLGAGKYDDDGYLFVPDGSGALIDYNKYGLKKILYTTNTVYGMDYSLSFEYEFNSLSEQNYLPVYGNKAGDKAIFAIIEEGEALASVISESGNILTAYETVYPEFHFATAYTVNYTDSSKIRGLYTYHDSNVYQGDYVVRYRFLTGENADYSGMAKSYQDYLVERGFLTKLPDTESESNFYIETLGAVERTDTFMGIPYTKSVALTTFSQAEDILSYMQEAGAGQLKLRYKGWMNGGLYYTVSDGVDIEKSLGGTKGLTALEAYARANNITLYPETDFYMVGNDKSFDGYSYSKNSARSITREKLYLLSPEGFTNLPYLQYASYSVSPYYYDGYMQKYFKDYNELSLSGISLGNMGNMLYTEYDKKKAMNREQVKETVVNGLATYTADKCLMVDGGNAYTLPYATDIVNVPMNNSAHTLEDESIPFMQMVFHGYKHYAGSAMNLADDYEEQFLKSIEYGASPFFTVAADNTSLLKETQFCYYYSVDWDSLKEDMKACALEWKEAYDGLENLSMVSHEKIDTGVYRTEYEDGTVFYVNYNDNEVTLPDGEQLAAKDYVKTGKR